jgi:BirA family transcriptional regulator, biotin operon repressor / biotin---[acetyl-CoA-carboxylase] ligase
METLFVGQNTIFLPEVDSTNSYAMSLLKNVKAIEGTVIYTFHQTQGRGQRGNYWQAEEGSNIAYSAILKPNFISASDAFSLYILSALTVYDVLAHLLHHSQNDIKIKWPNDILINGKKIAGILVETSIQNNLLLAAVVGIGLNINQSQFTDLPMATSLKQITGKHYHLKEIVDLLCIHLEKNYLKLKNGHFNELKDLYLTHLFKRNERQLFRIQNKEETFLINGISNEGLLQLKDLQNNILNLGIKEVEWIL